MTSPILVELLTKSYGKRRGVVDLSFEVGAGEIFGYLGPNGAGKTTTIRTLLDFIRPTSGRATVLDLDSRIGSLEIHRRIGYLPGEFGLYERMSGAEYLEFLARLRGGVDRAEVAGLADRFRLDLSSRIGALSHGNRQKIGLVQAFMHQPELLILDEPTQGLDPLMQQEFYGLLVETRRAGSTVFLSSHVLPEVERVCDRVGIIREGRLAAVEDVAEVKTKALRSLEIRFAEPVGADQFAGVEGVRGVSVDGDSVRLEVAGSLDAVVKAAARFEIVDLRTHEPSLEDIFLTYYGDGGAI